MIMKYILKAEFRTDGDYRIDTDEISKLNENHKSEVYFSKGCESYEIASETENYDLARDSLESLARSFRVGHYWLIGDLFNLCDKTLKALRDKETFNNIEWMYGNYDGTYISLLKRGEEIEQKKKELTSVLRIANKLGEALTKYDAKKDEVDYCRAEVLYQDVYSIMDKAINLIGEMDKKGQASSAEGEFND